METEPEIERQRFLFQELYCNWWFCIEFCLFGPRLFEKNLLPEPVSFCPED